MNMRTNFKCPYCCKKFRAEETLWISTTEGLNDKVIEDGSKRFLPTHFTTDCHAIDERGEECYQIACPNCHIEIPKEYLNATPLIGSIVGSRGSGKTYFLMSLVWWMKNHLCNHYRIDYTSGLTRTNEEIDKQIERTFSPRTRSDEWDILEFTPSGRYGMDVRLPNLGGGSRRFIMPSFHYLHQECSRTQDGGRNYILCLYDHAGEDFRSSDDSTTTKLTKHLGFSDLLLYLYDPTQNRNFVSKYKSNQSSLVGMEMKIETNNPEDNVVDAPDRIFQEMARRIKRINGGAYRGAKYANPVIIVVTKCDTWLKLLHNECQESLRTSPDIYQDGIKRLDERKIRDVSDDIQRLLQQNDPEFYNTVNSIASDVTYIPVSATGKQPSKNKGFVPGTLEPIWIGVPVLYGLARRGTRMIKLT